MWSWVSWGSSLCCVELILLGVFSRAEVERFLGGVTLTASACGVRATADVFAIVAFKALFGVLFRVLTLGGLVLVVTLRIPINYQLLASVANWRKKTIGLALLVPLRIELNSNTILFGK